GVELPTLLRDDRTEDTGVRQFGHIDPLLPVEADGLPELLVTGHEPLKLIANAVEEVVPRSPSHFDRNTPLCRIPTYPPLAVDDRHGLRPWDINTYTIFPIDRACPEHLAYPDHKALHHATVDETLRIGIPDCLLTPVLAAQRHFFGIRRFAGE